MPSKKRKTNRAKTKKQRSTKKARSRKETSKARGHRRSRKRSTGKAGSSNRRGGSRSRAVNTLSEIERETRDQRLTNAAVAGLQPDFQGLSRAEEADSESVEQLVEEGNILESGAVAGVEEADNKDEREVHPRELPEDDVPEEYLENQ